MKRHSINGLVAATGFLVALACAKETREPRVSPRASSPAMRCELDHADCDGDATNGCEVDLASNVSHCGRCDASCWTPNVASALCVGARCKIDACAGDFGDCDGVAINGCEGHVCQTSHGPDCHAKCEKKGLGYEF